MTSRFGFVMIGGRTRSRRGRGGAFFEPFGLLPFFSAGAEGAAGRGLGGCGRFEGFEGETKAGCREPRVTIPAFSENVTIKSLE